MGPLHVQSDLFGPTSISLAAQIHLRKGGIRQAELLVENLQVAGNVRIVVSIGDRDRLAAAVGLDEGLRIWGQLLKWRLLSPVPALDTYSPPAKQQ